MAMRQELLDRLRQLGFDTSQCDDMSEAKLAGWIEECELVENRSRFPALYPDDAIEMPSPPKRASRPQAK
jgi:hypothetical protein